MNILIPDSWLREHLKTKATPKKIAKALSLCSQSVEKIVKKNNDPVYEIEITTNRPDCLSVYGIAREASAALPRFGHQAQLKKIPEEKNKIPKIKKGLPLKVEIEKSSLCPRFTAIIFDQVTIKPSPRVIQNRLEKSGIRALNSVVDISNYLMLELGQPMHTFDYDKIKGAKMILRQSRKGEKITTLDNKTHHLPEKTIIIEDGEGRIIDLCGIMGGKNSEVDKKTKRVLLFVQTYDPMKIRQACQKLGFRTEAASRFERGVEPKGVIPAIKKAIVMFQKNCSARIASNLIDLYPNPLKPKKVTLTQRKLNRLMGIKVELAEAKKILESLGFLSTINYKQLTITSSIPHWRHDDISIPDDLVEEVARICGYHNLPTVLPQGEIPQIPKDPKFLWEQKIKQALKSWEFTETFNYSMVSENLLRMTGVKPENCLKIANPLTEEWVYMRPSLTPSILEVIAKNQDNFEKIKIFEIANIYLPQSKSQLPVEKPKLAGAVVGQNFLEVKGIVETLLKEMGIKNLLFEPTIVSQLRRIFHPDRRAEIKDKKTGQVLGVLGEIHPQILAKFDIKSRVVVFDLDFDQLVKYTTTDRTYTPIPRYPAIIEDLSFIVPEKTLVGEMIEEMSAIGGSASGRKKVSQLIQSVELIDSYQNTRTFRLTYQSPKRTLTDREVKKIRKKVINRLGKKIRTKLKT